MNDREKIVREVILNRRSTRWFSDNPIAREDLLDLVEAGVYAPSAANTQNQRFLIINDKDEIERIGRVRRFPYPSGGCNAAAIIVVFIDVTKHPYRAGEYNIWYGTWIQNGAASIENILLLAAAKGIGSCWISAIKNMDNTRLLSGKSWREVFSGYNIPDTLEVQGIVMLGYPHRYNSVGLPCGDTVHQGKPVARKDASFYLVGGGL